MVGFAMLVTTGPFLCSLLKISTKQGRNAAALQSQEMSYESEEGTMEVAAPHRAGSLHEQVVEETQQISYRSRESDAGTQLDDNSEEESHALVT